MFKSYEADTKMLAYGHSQNLIWTEFVICLYTWVYKMLSDNTDIHDLSKCELKFVLKSKKS